MMLRSNYYGYIYLLLLLCPNLGEGINCCRKAPPLIINGTDIFHEARGSQLLLAFVEGSNKHSKKQVRGLDLLLHNFLNMYVFNFDQLFYILIFFKIIYYNYNVNKKKIKLLAITRSVYRKASEFLGLSFLKEKKNNVCGSPFEISLVCTKKMKLLFSFFFFFCSLSISVKRYFGLRPLRL